MTLRSGRKAIIIDFEDSFVFNIKDLFQRRFTRVEVIPWVAIQDSLFNSSVFDNFSSEDLLVLGPGPGHVLDYSLNEFRQFISEQNYKVMGVCLGHQLLCHWLGYSLEKRERPLHGKSLTLDSFCGREKNPFKAQFYNSWQVLASKGLDKSFYQDMLTSFTQGNHLGIQFHLESVGTSCPTTILDWSLENLYN